MFSEWCHNKSLGVNSDKTEVVMFTRKYKSEVIKKFSVHGSRIPYAECVKYLGVGLDKKLKWRQYLQIQCRKCRSAIRKTCRLELQAALWSHEAIRKPKLAYAALV